MKLSFVPCAAACTALGAAMLFLCALFSHPSAGETITDKPYVAAIPGVVVSCVIALARQDNTASPRTHEEVCINPGKVTFTGTTPDAASARFFNLFADKIKSLLPPPIKVYQ